MATNFTMYRYAGETTGWVELHPKTNADQVNQTETRVFLHPTTNKINGKAFGSIVSNVWTPSAITLYGTDISLSSSDATTISSSISALTNALANTIKSENTIPEGEIVIGSAGTNRLVEGSGFTLSTDKDDIDSQTENYVIVSAYAIGDYINNDFTGNQSINTVGTITSGTWNGSVIGLAYGGLGVNASTTAGKATARQNLGLGAAATHGIATTASDIGSATDQNEDLTTAYAVQQYVATIRITYTTVWDKTDYESTTAPSATKLSTIPKGVKVKYNRGASESSAGTLDPAVSQTNKVLLIYSPNDAGDDAYDEYLCVVQGSSYVWERIGSTSVDLSNYVQADNTLTADKVILGNGDKKVYASSYSITSTVGSDPGYLITSSGVNSYLANSYEGSTHITKLGTIATGTWQGTAIAADYVGNLPSSKITTMTGYSEPQSSGAIATTDSLNQAIGKLERKADTNSTNIGTNTTDITNLKARAQIFWADNTSDVSGMKTGDFAFIY